MLRGPGGGGWPQVLPQRFQPLAPSGRGSVLGSPLTRRVVPGSATPTAPWHLDPSLQPPPSSLHHRPGPRLDTVESHGASVRSVLSTEGFACTGLESRDGKISTLAASLFQQREQDWDFLPRNSVSSCFLRRLCAVLPVLEPHRGAPLPPGPRARSPSQPYQVHTETWGQADSWVCSCSLLSCFLWGPGCRARPTVPPGLLGATGCGGGLGACAGGGRSPVC